MIPYSKLIIGTNSYGTAVFVAQFMNGDTFEAGKTILVRCSRD